MLVAQQLLKEVEEEVQLCCHEMNFVVIAEQVVLRLTSKQVPKVHKIRKIMSFYNKNDSVQKNHKSLNFLKSLFFKIKLLISLSNSVFTTKK